MTVWVGRPAFTYTYTVRQEKIPSWDIIAPDGSKAAPSLQRDDLDRQGNLTT